MSCDASIDHLFSAEVASYIAKLRRMRTIGEAKLVKEREQETQPDTGDILEEQTGERMRFDEFSDFVAALWLDEGGDVDGFEFIIPQLRSRVAKLHKKREARKGDLRVSKRMITRHLEPQTPNAIQCTICKMYVEGILYHPARRMTDFICPECYNEKPRK